MVLYYVHRYMRLTPAFLLVVLVSINLTPYFGNGPLFPSEQGFETPLCRSRYWWTSILYIGNIVQPDHMCLTVSWYLHNDMQFHWIAPLALIPFVLGRKRIGVMVGVIFVLISIGSISGTLIRYPYMVNGTLQPANRAANPTFINAIYYPPWCRISPYAIGLIVGFIIINTGRTCPLRMRTKLIGTSIAFAISFACIFIMFADSVLRNGLSPKVHIAYQTLSRPLWSLAIGWMIFLCSTDQGGIVNTILSWPIWAPLSDYEVCDIGSSTIDYRIRDKSLYETWSEVTWYSF
ncbi:unnamed protein product [Rotaria sp. Silwood1]|nr:unnamed protein product [Rotaria sp. Silwood1]CAF1453046.1 unnamed protein product [Rotaria sp. Silwood1]CAF3548710.1 unnamed protein product [Rotaria sp. Silwood1]CAF3696428.1 unnamed protein product [Rotaria sp. Silwood1]CAF4883299.1 unnamed protein product [Rotaria sp. Silwood1]